LRLLPARTPLRITTPYYTCLAYGYTHTQTWFTYGRTHPGTRTYTHTPTWTCSISCWTCLHLRVLPACVGTCACVLPYRGGLPCTPACYCLRFLFLVPDFPAFPVLPPAAAITAGSYHHVPAPDTCLPFAAAGAACRLQQLPGLTRPPPPAHTATHSHRQLDSDYLPPHTPHHTLHGSTGYTVSAHRPHLPHHHHLTLPACPAYLPVDWLATCTHGVHLEDLPFGPTRHSSPYSLPYLSPTQHISTYRLDCSSATATHLPPAPHSLQIGLSPTLHLPQLDRPGRTPPLGTVHRGSTEGWEGCTPAGLHSRPPPGQDTTGSTCHTYLHTQAWDFHHPTQDPTCRGYTWVPHHPDTGFYLPPTTTTWTTYPPAHPPVYGFISLPFYLHLHTWLAYPTPHPTVLTPETTTGWLGLQPTCYITTTTGPHHPVHYPTLPQDWWKRLGTLPDGLPVTPTPPHLPTTCTHHTPHTYTHDQRQLQFLPDSTPDMHTTPTHLPPQADTRFPQG